MRKILLALFLFFLVPQVNATNSCGGSAGMCCDTIDYIYKCSDGNTCDSSDFDGCNSNPSDCKKSGDVSCNGAGGSSNCLLVAGPRCTATCAAPGQSPMNPGGCSLITTAPAPTTPSGQPTPTPTTPPTCGGSTCGANQKCCDDQCVDKNASCFSAACDNLCGSSPNYAQVPGSIGAPGCYNSGLKPNVTIDRDLGTIKFDFGCKHTWSYSDRGSPARSLIILRSWDINTPNNIVDRIPNGQGDKTISDSFALQNGQSYIFVPECSSETNDALSKAKSVGCYRTTTVDGGGSVCNIKPNMSVSPNPVSGVGSDVTFSVSGSQGSTYLSDQWSGGVNCTGGFWGDKTCQSTAGGTYSWTHTWRECHGLNCNDVRPPLNEAACSKTVDYTITSPPTVKGYLGATNCTAITGWTGDTSDRHKPTDVYFYFDGKAGTGVEYDPTPDLTTIKRESAVCQALGGTAANCNVCNNPNPPNGPPQCIHGFNYPLPKTVGSGANTIDLFDGTDHKVYAYGLDITKDPSKTVLLTDSPKTVRCSPTDPTNLQGSCPVPGTSATVSWDPVPGAAYYSLRVDKDRDGLTFSPTCLSSPSLPFGENKGTNGDICMDLLANSYIINGTVPGDIFRWWVHARTSSGAWIPATPPNLDFSCPALPPTLPPNTPTPIPPGPWIKLKDSSFQSKNDLVNNIPLSPALYDADDTDDPFFILNSAGLVLGENLISIPSTAKFSDPTTANYSADDYPSLTYQLNPTSFLSYVKARKEHKVMTSSDLTQIDSPGIYVYTDNLTLNNTKLNLATATKFVLIVNGDVNIDYVKFNIDNADNDCTGPATKNIAILSTGKISFRDTTKCAAGIFIAGNIDTGETSNQGLKIIGNLIAQTSLINDREWTDPNKPSLFIKFDPVQYINLLPYLSTANYNWTQLQ